MESPEDDQFLSGLAEAIADGRPISWADLPGSGTSRHADRLKELRVLEALSSLHRSPEATVGHPSGAAAPRTPLLATWAGFELIEQIGQGSFGVV